MAGAYRCTLSGGAMRSRRWALGLAALGAFTVLLILGNAMRPGHFAHYMRVRLPYFDQSVSFIKPSNVS